MFALLCLGCVANTYWVAYDDDDDDFKPRTTAYDCARPADAANYGRAAAERPGERAPDNCINLRRARRFWAPLKTEIAPPPPPQSRGRLSVSDCGRGRNDTGSGGGGISGARLATDCDED